jgi:cytochrome o ubiquinol oxidase subunit 1
VFGFAMTWRVWWLAGLGLLAVIVLLIVRSFRRDIDYEVPAEEVEQIESGYFHPQGADERERPAPAQEGKIPGARQPT